MTCEAAQRAIALAAMVSPDSESGYGFESLQGTQHSVSSPSPGRGGEEASPYTGRGSSDRFFPNDPPSDSWREASYSGTEPGPASLNATGPALRAAFGQGEMRPSGPSAQSALADHLSVCRSCQAELAATTAFFRALAHETDQNGPEPSATLLARARMQLDASLDSSAQAGPWTLFTRQIMFSAGRLRAAPALSSALLLAGLLAGGYGGYRAGHAAHAAEQDALLLAPPAPEAPSVVADVSSVSRDPGTGLVEVRYDRLVSDVLTAPAEDPSIRELLMAATQNGIDPQVRNVSVSLLSGGCGAGAPCPASDSASNAALNRADAAPVRNALMNALESDKTPEVRREALAGLGPFIADNTEVRDAVLSALMSDPSASVRIEAVRLLQPVDVDSSVRQVLHTVALRDGDPSIRSASLAALRSVPQIQ